MLKKIFILRYSTPYICLYYFHSRIIRFQLRINLISTDFSYYSSRLNEDTGAKCYQIWFVWPSIIRFFRGHFVTETKCTSIPQKSSGNIFLCMARNLEAWHCNGNAVLHVSKTWTTSKSFNICMKIYVEMIPKSMTLH